MILLISLALSAAFGYVAAQLMGLRGKWYIYLLLGLAGGLVGSILFGFIGFSADSLMANAIVSIVGSCLVIFLYRQLMK
ncbi:MAG: GlsB/YeaQ/YmgE family stress response membrane protein [Erysipelotrichaceae bacterium]|nr:GlsB/YeaQ/YmgE family stress response membrane protein [Erysipelotrichaceae bacterium]